MIRNAKTKKKPRIGRREYVALPEWGVDHIEAKIDTGARTSAIHVEDITLLKGGRVRFHLVTHIKKPFRHKLVRADIVRRTRVRSSMGHSQDRIVVATTIRIGEVNRRIETSLVRRDKMLCRMLLGRTALGGFLIDVDRKHVQANSKVPRK